MSIDTHLDATPSDITSSATKIGDIKSHVDSAETDMISARSSVVDLRGTTAGAVYPMVNSCVTNCETLVSNLGSYKTALDNLASALGSIKTDLEGIRSRATEGGLTLSDETIDAPTPSSSSSSSSAGDSPSVPGDSPSGTEVDNSDAEFQQKMILYTTLATETSDIRTREKEARQNFVDACQKITNPIYHAVAAGVKDYVRPSAKGGGWIAAATAGKWGVSRAKDAVKLTRAAALRASGADVARYRKWATSHSAKPGAPARRWIRGKNPVMTEAGGKGTWEWKHAFNDRKLGNWKVPASAEGSRSAKIAETAGKIADSNALKYAGRAGTAVSFGVDAYQQWQKDSKDPSIGTGEKVTRAATKGAVSAGGAWVGAEAGAAIGACVGGPVGAAVGGIVGGAIGSGVASKVADGINAGIHKLWH